MPEQIRAWHAGELAAQQARGYEDAVWGQYEALEPGLPNSMRPFLEQLPFLPLTTLDDAGRPWGSLLMLDGSAGFLMPRPDDSGEDEEHGVVVRARVPQDTPLRQALARAEGKQEVLCAAVGVMLHNRRRNKFEGRLVDVKQLEEDVVEFTIDHTSTMGNCPKYINLRQLVKSDARPRRAINEPQPALGSALPSDLVAVVQEAELVFLHTKHTGSSGGYHADPSRLGCNLRGGPRGFLRSYFDEKRARTAVVLPDWSGNRMLQSFGNVSHDGVAGISIPQWGMRTSRGDSTTRILHLTGDAEVLAGGASSAVIKGVAGCMILWITGWNVIEGLPLVIEARHAELRAREAGVEVDDQMLLDASIGWSPYNPPVRYLVSERPSTLLAQAATKGAAPPQATLVKAAFASEQIATFTWLVERKYADAWAAGKHLIVDAHEALDTRVKMYQHMSFARGGEKDLNDDGVRSWTISASRPSSEVEGTTELDVTLRRTPRGGVTPGLFARGKRMVEGQAAGAPLVLPLLGIEGEMLLPAAGSAAQEEERQAKTLAYFVAGIGITPLLAHLPELRARSGAQGETFHVLVVLATRAADAETMLQLLHTALASPRPPQAGEAAGQLDVQVHMLVGASEATPALSSSSSDSAINLCLHTHVDVRLSPDSLLDASPSATAGEEGAFVLPAADAQRLRLADAVFLCGPPRFEGVARAALRKAGVDATRVRSESFSF